MRTALPVLVLGVFFLASAYIAQTYEDSLTAFIGSGLSGVLVYSLLAITGTVVAPLSSLPLMPLASALWGAPLAAVISVLSWWIGGIIAFGLSRKFGRPLVEKLISEERLEQVEARLPEKRQFWAVALLSLILSTDVLSYAFGLFKNVSLKTYAPAMLLGNIPFAFVFAYLGVLPFKYQLLIVPVVITISIFWFRRRKT